MKTYRRLIAGALILTALVFLLVNSQLLGSRQTRSRVYRVEISRAVQEIRERGPEGLDLSLYPSLIRVEQGSAEDPGFLEGEGDDYVLREVAGTLYRFDYCVPEKADSSLLLTVNLGLGALGILLLGTLGLVSSRILKPFDRLRSLPRELAKGNLTMPLGQEKQKYFGDFLWGMDLLREKLEHDKVEQLKLQKEKKSLVLSLAHDIRTPLSAIKLYSSALSRNLYTDAEKRQQTAEQIGKKADEMEDYLKKLVEASQEDFLHLEVHCGTFYLRELLEEIRDYYMEKLKLLKIPFSMDMGENCLLKGDRDRCVEILQNLMENAIKYGEGSKITVSSREEGDCRIITLSNGNCSLPSEELPHIFDSFWRGSNSHGIQGSGLGLYICRALSRAMGGDIFAGKTEDRMEVSVVLPKA